MSKKKAATASAPKITAVKKGEVYETKHQELIEVVNGRLKDEGELGTSFDGKTITFNTKTLKADRTKTAERHYLDDLARKLSKAEYDEWVEVGQREAEATVEGQVETTTTKKTTAKPKAAPKAKKEKPVGKMSALDAAAKVLGEAGAAMTTGAMIEQMAAKKYWVSPGGKTPAATLYAAILREINVKGKDSRFTKADRGLFATK